MIDPLHMVRRILRRMKTALTRFLTLRDIERMDRRLTEIWDRVEEHDRRMAELIEGANRTLEAERRAQDRLRTQSKEKDE